MSDDELPPLSAFTALYPKTQSTESSIPDITEDSELETRSSKRTTKECQLAEGSQELPMMCKDSEGKCLRHQFCFPVVFSAQFSAVNILHANFTVCLMSTVDNGCDQHRQQL